MALSGAAQEAIWMRELNSDQGNLQSQPTLIYEDNQSIIAHYSDGKKLSVSLKVKHIHIKYHFIREQDKICLKYYPTEDMLADLLTKGIGPEKFKRFRRL